jgi:glycerate kinase
MKIEAAFGILGDQKTAVIEMAAASGLALLKPQDRNPLYTTTYGTGELMMAAVAMGVELIILGIGGSATVDGGIGCAQACGLPVLLDEGEPVSSTEPLVGQDLERVVRIKHGRGSPIDRTAITVACDVDNPLFGPNGAAAIYGPQKGASSSEVATLDRWLRDLAQKTGTLSEAMTPGAGAAGGLGYCLLAFFRATLKPGFEIVSHAARLRERLSGVDLCITGEGSFDLSSFAGKTPIGVARICKQMNIPCIAIAGRVDTTQIDRARSEGIQQLRDISSPSTPNPMERAAELLQQTAAEVIAEFAHRS